MFFSEVTTGLGTRGGLQRGTPLPQWGISNSGNPGLALTASPGEPGLLELVLERHAEDLGPVVPLVVTEEDRGSCYARAQERLAGVRLPVVLGERLVDVEELAGQGLREMVLKGGLEPGIGVVERRPAEGDVVGLVGAVDSAARRVRAVLLDPAQRGGNRPR